MSITASPAKIVYPDRDGQPMADNTLQFDWIGLFKWELDALFADNAEVFVAGDLLWYPVEGHPEIRIAPDVMLAFGRPKGYRGSYRQWEEGNIAPQVVFEILSPGNRLGEMSRKFDFYERYGAEEYYVYDPDDFGFTGWLRPPGEARFQLIPTLDSWVSPRLGVRFESPGDRDLVVHRPDGVSFRTPLEIRRDLEQTKGDLVQTRGELEQTQGDLVQTQEELGQAQSEAERLKAKLRELGVDPDTF